MKNTTQQPLKRKWTSPIDNSGKMGSHVCQIEFPILYNWTIPFPFLGLLGGIFYF